MTSINIQSSHINLSELSDKRRDDIGALILHEINISLLNATPKQAKMYQIYKGLLFAGIQKEDIEVVYNRIGYFIKERTLKNQALLFYKIFRTEYTGEMRSLFSLSFRTAIVGEQDIKTVAYRLNDLFSDIGLSDLGVDYYTIRESLESCYDPKYYENEWKIGLKHFLDLIEKSLKRQNKNEHQGIINSFFKSLIR